MHLTTAYSFTFLALEGFVVEVLARKAMRE